MPGQYNSTYTKKNGAKEGLEKKLSYWKDRDYEYEFGVSVGMALNLAITGNVDSKGPEDWKEKAKEIFKCALELKLDPELIAIFDAYYAKKKGHDETVVEVK